MNGRRGVMSHNRIKQSLIDQVTKSIGGFRISYEAFILPSQQL